MSIHRRFQESAEQNPLLPLALGLVSALDTLDRHLADAGGDGGATTPHPGASEPPLEPDDPFVLAALGAVALRRSLATWLTAACATPGAVDAPHADEPSDAGRSTPTAARHRQDLAR